MLRMKKSYVILFLFYFIAVEFGLKKEEEKKGLFYVIQKNHLVRHISAKGTL